MLSAMFPKNLPNKFIQSICQSYSWAISPTNRWCIFDVAVSAWPTIVITFIFSTYFTKSIAADPQTGAIMWAHLMTTVGILVAFTSPILGAIADQHAGEKVWLIVFTLGVICTSILLWFAYPSQAAIYTTLMICGAGCLCAEYATLFFNALLPRVAAKTHIGRMSGYSSAFAYLGGLILLTAILTFLINPSPPLWGLDSESAMQVRIIGPCLAVWILIFALPLMLLKLPTNNSKRVGYIASIKTGVSQLKKTIQTVRHNHTLVNFFIGRMFLADGLNTLYGFAGIYAAGTFGFSLADVIAFGIACNVAAGMGAMSLAWLDDFLGPKKLILINLFCILCFTVMILLATHVAIFVIFGISCTFFIGSVQSASRSYLAKITPMSQRSELFGFFSLSGKATAFAGPMALAQFMYWFQSQRAGITAVLLFFMAAWHFISKLPEAQSDTNLTMSSATSQAA